MTIVKDKGLVRAEAGEALAADHENQIAELCLGLDQAEGRVAELEGTLSKVAVLDVGRPIPRDGNEAEFVEAFIAGQDDARGYVKKIVEQALSGDGSRIMDVIYRHRKGGLYRIIARGRLESDLTPVVIYQALAGSEYWVRPTAEFEDGRFEALDRLDGKEPTP